MVKRDRALSYCLQYSDSENHSSANRSSKQSDWCTCLGIQQIEEGIHMIKLLIISSQGNVTYDNEIIAWFWSYLEKYNILYYEYIAIDFFWNLDHWFFFSFLSSLGIINLCKPGNSGIQSLIGVLCIPNMEIRVGKSYSNCFIPRLLTEEINCKNYFRCCFFLMNYSSVS